MVVLLHFCTTFAPASTQLPPPPHTHHLHTLIPQHTRVAHCRQSEGGSPLAHKLIDLYFSLFALILEGKMGHAAAVGAQQVGGRRAAHAPRSAGMCGLTGGREGFQMGSCTHRARCPLARSLSGSACPGS